MHGKWTKRVAGIHNFFLPSTINLYVPTSNNTL